MSNARSFIMNSRNCSTAAISVMISMKVYIMNALYLMRIDGSVIDDELR